MKFENNHIGKLIFWLAVLASLWGLSTVLRVFTDGLQILGLNQSLVWGVLITNFVFWIGLAHAGTFISAILLLMRQNWRTGIHRLAEATTLVAIVIALVMPLIHLGRPLMFYELLPNPNLKMNFQIVNFSSPLSWDFYAILVYFILSVIFIFIGLIPDFGILHQRNSQSLRSKIYRHLSLHWQGSISQWLLQKKATFIMAALIAPLVISVHTIVSFDFAIGLNPGWHHTSFPVYFVTGAIFSGFALVQLSLVIMENFSSVNIRVSQQQRDNMNKVMLFCSVLLGSFYLSDLMNFSASGNGMLTEHISQFFHSSAVLLSLILILVIPQFFWFKKIRTSKLYSALTSVLILIGMWLERFGIVIQNQQISLWRNDYHKSILTLADFSLVAGSLGIFILLLLALSKIIPLQATYENDNWGKGGSL